MFDIAKGAFAWLDALLGSIHINMQMLLLNAKLEIFIRLESLIGPKAFTLKRKETLGE